MNIEDVAFYTTPLTLHDMILIQKVGHGDYEAVLDYIVKRTNLTIEQALALELQEIAAVLEKLREAIGYSTVLSDLSKSFEEF